MKDSKLFGLVGANELENLPTTLNEQKALASGIWTDIESLIPSYPEKGPISTTVQTGLSYFLKKVAQMRSIEAHPKLNEDPKVKGPIVRAIKNLGLSLQENLGEFADGIAMRDSEPVFNMNLRFKKLCASVGLTQEDLDTLKKGNDPRGL